MQAYRLRFVVSLEDALRRPAGSLLGAESDSDLVIPSGGGREG
jgi:hypothetical protein